MRLPGANDNRGRTILSRRFYDHTKTFNIHIKILREIKIKKRIKKITQLPSKSAELFINLIFMAIYIKDGYRNIQAGIICLWLWL